MLDLANIESVPSDGSHITAEQVHAIEAYVAQLLKALDLAHWRVAIDRDLPPEGAILSILPWDGRRFATLAVRTGWYEETSPNAKRVDLTHEVLHLAHHDTDEGIRRYFDHSGDVSDYVKDIVTREFSTNLERMVDSLSYVIAPFMPEWEDHA